MKVHGKEITPETIWMCRQNLPELVVQDCIKEFNFTEEQAEKLRFILMIRGVNKWLYARRKFINLKHQVKDVMQQARFQYFDLKQTDKKEIFKILEKINAEMQNIAKLPRWIEFPKTITHNWDKIEEGIIIKGRHC